jgi:hypothetical protein
MLWSRYQLGEEAMVALCKGLCRLGQQGVEPEQLALADNALGHGAQAGHARLGLIMSTPRARGAWCDWDLPYLTPVLATII